MSTPCISPVLAPMHSLPCHAVLKTQPCASTLHVQSSHRPSASLIRTRSAQRTSSRVIQPPSPLHLHRERANLFGLVSHHIALPISFHVDQKESICGQRRGVEGNRGQCPDGPL
ncbi:hypothetical protein HETIRDRAFT_432933 [Heterobasidion irregulare TC 32-1]|uniref:Uncharacterized protein n=1 Tax=Heterobasidion irregulare (strain TC 32-1) TaxID=747525 RepID=W4KDN2_HETIT|nr:uncharacterized protein HETIRDRAFT_432933 [Heterobasidion irregulare TC 32-1]ETW83903.1 hypothetical protein HETIRDRAFT_432933 [Heterobasidion irregulare TC 32-1]